MYIRCVYPMIFSRKWKWKGFASYECNSYAHLLVTMKSKLVWICLNATSETIWNIFEFLSSAIVGQWVGTFVMMHVINFLFTLGTAAKNELFKGAGCWNTSSGSWMMFPQCFLLIYCFENWEKNLICWPLSPRAFLFMIWNLKYTSLSHHFVGIFFLCLSCFFVYHKLKTLFQLNYTGLLMKSL